MRARIIAGLYLVLALLVAAVTSGAAAPERPQAWQVNVTFPGLPAEANPSEPEGRVEVYVNGRWLFCVAASYHRPAAGEVTLELFSLSFAFEGRADDFRVEAFDELRRLGDMTIAVKPALLPPVQIMAPR